MLSVFALQSVPVFHVVLCFDLVEEFVQQGAEVKPAEVTLSDVYLLSYYYLE